ncbi:MAG: alanine racemase [Planctomycetota bacterium]|jgi:D-serine deaminase-like pyridoxal phosphate-dependent protein
MAATAVPNVAIEELETPAPVVDAAKLQANIDRMAAAAREAGIALRPHIKTHKTREICELQRAAGAGGFTFAKPSEAEALGFGEGDRICNAYPAVGPRIERLLDLQSAGVELLATVDSEAGLRDVAARAAARGATLDCLLKIDVGYHRCGVPADSPFIAAAVTTAAGLEGVRLRGVLSHGGHSYGAGSPEAAAAIARDEGELTVRAAQRLRELGVEDPIVSVGSTPTAMHVRTVPGVTEMRPGTYVFYDATQVTLGAATAADCALRIVCRVVSRSAGDHAVIDGGSKTFTNDRLAPQGGGPSGGLVFTGLHADTVQEDIRVARFAEEHGILEGPGAKRLRVGDLVSIAPAHACGCTNLHERLWVAEQGRVVDQWEVVARGRIW